MIAAIAGDRVAIVDSATATASALAELLSVSGLEAPGATRGTAADAGRADHERSDETAAVPVHVQLTTGDVASFRGLATRLFGEAFTDVAAVELRSGSPTGPASATEKSAEQRSTAGAGGPTR